MPEPRRPDRSAPDRRLWLGPVLVLVGAGVAKGLHFLRHVDPSEPLAFLLAYALPEAFVVFCALLLACTLSLSDSKAFAYPMRFLIATLVALYVFDTAIIRAVDNRLSLAGALRFLPEWRAISGFLSWQALGAAVVALGMAAVSVPVTRRLASAGALLSVAYLGFCLVRAPSPPAVIEGYRFRISEGLVDLPLRQGL